MARTPEDETQRLKTDISLEQLCERYGIALERLDGCLVGFCPWHQDETPSFVVTPEKNLWRCVGACHQGGDRLSLIMKAEKVSFRRAVARLRELQGDSVPE